MCASYTDSIAGEFATVAPIGVSPALLVSVTHRDVRLEKNKKKKNVC